MIELLYNMIKHGKDAILDDVVIDICKGLYDGKFYYGTIGDIAYWPLST